MAWVDADLLYKLNPASAKEVAQGIDYAKRKVKARFYADENFPAQATEILRDAGLDILTVQEAGKRHHPDANHAAYALRECRVLLTLDRDYLDERRFPLIHCPAIVVFDFGPGSAQHIKRAFRCLRLILRIPQFYDKWAKIDAKTEVGLSQCDTSTAQPPEPDTAFTVTRSKNGWKTLNREIGSSLVIRDGFLDGEPIQYLAIDETDTN